MDLRSERPFWPTTCRRPPLTRSRRSRLKVDVLIVGAGITGALVAHALVKAGATVAIADRRPAGSGSTPASTALLQYEIDTPLVELAGMIGKTRASRAYRESRRALIDIKHLSDELGDRVDLVPRRSLHLAVKPSDAADFRMEAAARRALGFPVTLLSQHAMHAKYGLRRPGAILSEEAYEINPLKLTYELLRAACEDGAVMLPKAKVDLSCVVQSKRPFRVSIPQADGSGGETGLTAERIVIATGYEAPEEFAAIKPLTELRATYALCTAPLKKEPWPGAALLWEAGDPYFYARTTRDGRVMIGGEDEPFTTPLARDALIASKSRTLMKKLRTLIPGVAFRPAFRWAGTFAGTKDGLPYIGEHPRWPGVSFALGYGGNGITFSTIAAKVIAADVAGKPIAAARLFGFDR